MTKFRITCCGHKMCYGLSKSLFGLIFTHLVKCETEITNEGKWYGKGWCMKVREVKSFRMTAHNNFTCYEGIVGGFWLKSKREKNIVCYQLLGTHIYALENTMSRIRIWDGISVRNAFGGGVVGKTGRWWMLAKLCVKVVNNTQNRRLPWL